MPAPETRARSRRGQRGVATVELAVVTPVLLVMLLVSAEFTRAFHDYNTLTKSVRDAARYLAEDAYNGANVFEIDATRIERAKALAASGRPGGGPPLLEGLDVDDVTVDIDNAHHGSAPALREHVRVSASYRFRPLMPAIAGMGFLPADVDMGLTLVASSTMRALR